MRFLKSFFMVLVLAACASQEIEPLGEVVRQDVYFAGVSFTGNYKDNSLNYPYSYDISKQKPLDTLFIQKLEGLNNPSINLLTSLGDVNKSDALALSLAIDLETVSVAQIEAHKYKMIADLYTQILVFDFNEKKVINSYPINLEYITLFDHEPNKSEISSIFASFYTGENSEVKTNLFDLAVSKMNGIRIKPKYGNRLKVANVNISKDAAKILAEFKQPEDNFKTILAQSFSRYMVDNQGVAMLPYIKGQSIGGKMAARFVNGDIFDLEIPSADYVFDIDILDFKTLIDDTQSKTTFNQGFLVYTKIALIQPDLNKKYMDSKFRGAEQAVLIKGQQAALKLSYLETTMNLFNQFAKNITQTDDSWYENTFDPSTFSQVKKEFRQIRDIVKHCK